jgi:hypothetical protein
MSGLSSLGLFRLRFQFASPPGPTSFPPIKKNQKKIREVGVRGQKKIGSFSLIERVILSAGAMLIFSVSFLLSVLVEIKI